MGVKIFFCYAREDEPLLNKLKTHLRPLQRDGLIEVWYDRDISAGTEWETEIKLHLNAAQIVLLLISPDFMNSDYCYGKEMKWALERHAKGEANVIPIILEYVYWQVEPLRRLQALPSNANPIVSATWHSQNEALFNVAEGIRKVALELSKMPIPIDVAKWMRDKIIEDKTMYQKNIVYKIRDEFGEEFIYMNDNGNPAISKAVLKEFQKLTENLVVWEKGERCWRLRGERDTPGKRQVDY